MLFPIHGANATTLYEMLQIQMPEKILDMSENVNHLRIPNLLDEIEEDLLSILSYYPHEQAEPLKSAIAQFHEIAPEEIVVSNGTSESLMVLAQFLRGQSVVLIEPSFSEYRRTLVTHSCEIIEVTIEDLETYTCAEEKIVEALQRATALYICNPNNPTGVVWSKQIIESFLKRYPNHWFIVDEAFMDWTDEKESVINLVKKYPSLIVLRSLTKMYALAGVRLGYIVSRHTESLSAYFPHWHVNGLAIALGTKCLKQQDFVERSRNQVKVIREEMNAFFQMLNCRVTKSEVNFLSFSLPLQYDADEFYFYLLSKGIVLRHTKNFKVMNGQWFRIAIKDRASWEICKEVIKKYVKNN